MRKKVHNDKLYYFQDGFNFVFDFVFLEFAGFFS